MREIPATENKDLLGQVVVVLQPAHDRVGDGAAAGLIVGAVQRRKIRRGFVGRCFAIRGESRRQVGGLTVAAGQREAQVHPAFPRFQ